MAMFDGKAKTVAEYLKGLPEDRRRTVAELRSVVKRHLPEGYEEGMGYGIITYAVPKKRLAETYNGAPLCYAGIAAKKNYYSLYLMGAYGNAGAARRLADGFKARGKKLDMGKACLRFKSLDDLPLDVIGEVIGSIPMDEYVRIYEASRSRSPKRPSAAGKTARGTRSAS